LENKYENYSPLFQIWRAGLGVKSRTRGQEGHRFESRPETFFDVFLQRNSCPNAVKMIGKWHGCMTSNPNKMTSFPWKFHRIWWKCNENSVGFAVIFDQTAVKMTWEKSMSHFFQGPVKIRTCDLLDLESDTLPLGQCAIFEREGNNSRTYSPKSSKIKNSKNNISMSRDRFKEDFQCKANSKWKLFIFIYYEYRKLKLFFKLKILADFEIKVHLHIGTRSTSCTDFI